MGAPPGAAPWTRNDLGAHAFLPSLASLGSWGILHWLPSEKKSGRKSRLSKQAQAPFAAS